MPRVDIWDVPESHPVEPLYCGYKRGIADKYEFDRALGEGGFGSVRVVRQKSNGVEFACKSICKRLDVPNLPPIKQQQHLENIQREVLILRKLRGTLNVVHLEAVYEDDTHVHIVMEYCRGGELFHRMGKRHYSERTVASYMRAVLRTLAQCHTHRILHRDIKPGNFMLLTEAEDAPLKAIDFGLAVLFEPGKLPLTDLGLEGTPWYMSPEVLASAVEPASDVWAAGVMAYQLLSGRFPFDDWQHPEAPALSLVWRSIIGEQPSFSRSGWQDVTDQAKDFVRALLNKDPRSRPSAREALNHPWLKKGNARQRGQGTQLTQVVQRLQRHNQHNLFKKTVLDMMANELLSRHLARVKEAEEAAAAAAAAEEQAAAIAEWAVSEEVHQEAARPAAAGPECGAAAADGHIGPPVSAGDRASPAAGVMPSSSLGLAKSLPCDSPDVQAERRLSGQLSGQPEFLRSLSSGPQAGIRTMSGPHSPGSVVVPHYLEGSVHRQQQLLRLIPPKRTHSSLDLSPAEVLGLKAPRTKDLSPGWSGPESQAAAGAAGGVSAEQVKQRLAALDRSWHGPGPAISPEQLKQRIALLDRSCPEPENQAAVAAASRLLAAAAARLEGTWHGPSPAAGVPASLTHRLSGEGRALAGLGEGSFSSRVYGASANGVQGSEGSFHGSGGWLEGSVHRQGSMRGATSALEALRRARERKSHADLALLGDLTPAAAAGEAAAGQAQQQQQPAAPPSPIAVPATPAAAAPSPIPPGSAAAAAGLSYRGPIRDPSSARLWDLQFMANRLAMEGSAHGNAFAHKLLRAGSTHAGRTPSSMAMFQAAAAPAQQQQDGTQQPLQQQQQQQEGPSAAALAALQPPQQQQLQQGHQGPSSPATFSDAAGGITADQMQQRLETMDRSWHGPGPAVAAEQLMQRIALLDRSWHGNTALMDTQAAACAQAAGKRGVEEREEFLRFLDAAKRQRQEQRKVARLVLEGSTHGGWQGFKPLGAGLTAGFDVAMDTDDDDEGLGGAGDSGSKGSTPGSSRRGGSAAAGAGAAGTGLPAAAAAAGGSERGDDSGSGKKGRNLFGKFKKSVKSLLSKDTPVSGAFSEGTASSTASDCGMKAVDSLNKLARDSWFPPPGESGGKAAADEAGGAVGPGSSGSSRLGQQQQQRPSTPPPPAADAGSGSSLAAAAASADSAPGAAAVPAAGSALSGNSVLAEQILELQSPGWQASLESRRRGQGAYAALMAATSMVHDGTSADAGPTAASGSAAAEPAAAQSQSAAAAPAAAAPAAATASGAGAVTAVKPLWAQQQEEEEQQQQEQQLEEQQQQQQQQQHQPAVTCALQPQSLLPVPGGSSAGVTPGVTAVPTPDQLMPKTAPQHVGRNLEPQPASSTPLQQLLLVQTQQQQKQRQQQSLLIQPGSQQQQQLASYSPPSRQQQQFSLQLSLQQQQFLVMPKPSQLPKVPEEPEQQQPPKQQPVFQRRDMLPQPSAAPFRPKPNLDLLPKPGGTPFRPGAKPPSDSSTPTPLSSTPKQVGFMLGDPMLPSAPIPTPAAVPAAAAPTPAAVSAGDKVGLPSAAAASPAAASAGPTAATPAATAPPAAAVPAAPAAAEPRSPDSAAAAVAGGTPLPVLEEVQQLLDLLQYDQHEVLTVEQLQHGLASLGYVLEPSEVLEIAKDLGYGVEGVEGVGLSQFAASQLDWEELQVNHRDEWLSCLRCTFEAMDADGDGRLKPADILEALKAKLPEAEVNAAIEDVLLEAAADEDEGMDFAAFKMLASFNNSSQGTLLDQYDARLAVMDAGSVRSRDDALALLAPVPEK